MRLQRLTIDFAPDAALGSSARRLESYLLPVIVVLAAVAAAAWLLAE